MGIRKKGVWYLVSDSGQGRYLIQADAEKLRDPQGVNENKSSIPAL